ncbi:unnamed protein product [marine sediment metagenome]|uniref:Uncharacterized protein n=1 Tax=marine sediment metagenome TaxID=412755 RepID=X0TJ83_9ZZZZ
MSKSKREDEAWDLIVAAKTQLGEHKKFLRNQLHEVGLPDARRNQLVQSVNEVALTQVRLAVNPVDRSPYAQVVYSYPDELFAYLESEDCHASLTCVLEGGINVTESDKPTAEDPMPKTGKSAERVKRFVDRR